MTWVIFDDFQTLWLCGFLIFSSSALIFSYIYFPSFSFFSSPPNKTETNFITDREYSKLDWLIEWLLNFSPSASTYHGLRNRKVDIFIQGGTKVMEQSNEAKCKLDHYLCSTLYTNFFKNGKTTTYRLLGPRSDIAFSRSKSFILYCFCVERASTHLSWILRHIH